MPFVSIKNTPINIKNKSGTFKPAATTKAASGAKSIRNLEATKPGAIHPLCAEVALCHAKWRPNKSAN
jgi:hypothetical protein